MNRQYFLHKADSYIDAIGYMACAGEIAETLEKATEGLK